MAERVQYVEVLPGTGTSDGGGVFQCVGACGQGLTNAGTGDSLCYSGSWTTGNGHCTTYAAMSVPSGQGDGTHGAIGSWDVSNVQSMRRRECRTTTTDIPVFVDSSPILTYIPISLSFSIISLL